MYKQSMEASCLRKEHFCLKKSIVKRALSCLSLFAITAVTASHSLSPLSPKEARANSRPRAAASGAGSLVVSPASLAFPAQGLGTTSGAVIALVWNYSSAAGPSSSISISGDFAQTNQCSSTVAGSCYIFVTFSPTATGTRNGTLTVTDVAGNPTTVQLSGLGIPAGAGATTTTLAAAGSSGNYNLTGMVVGTLASGSPTGNVSFVDTSNSNFSLGKASLGTAQIDLSLTNGPAVANTIPAQSLVSADFNGDGKPDLAVLNCTGICITTPNSGVSIFLGNGDGTFKLPPSQPSVPFGNDLVAGDFNGDGKMDLAVIGTGSGRSDITVLFGNGDGTFTPQSIAAPNAGYGYAASADFNKDGKSDLVVVTQNGVCPNCTYSATVLLGQANGTFTTSPAVTTSGASAVVVGDFNGDGYADFATIGFGASNSVPLQVFPGKGDGTFQSPLSTTAATNLFLEAGNHILATGDFNGDGKTDLVIVGGLSNGTTSTSDGFVVLTGKGDGTFTAGAPIAIPSPSGGSNSSSVAVADFNKDGRDDVIALNEDVVEVFLSNGDGTFTASTSVDSGAETSPDYLALVTGDFNGDGLPDFITANTDANDVTLEQAQRVETAVATLANVAVPGSGTHNVKAAYAGDSNFAASTSASLPLTAAPISTALALTSSAASSTSGTQLTLTATLTPDADGTLTTNGEAVTFMNSGSSIGTATLSSGVATLNVSSLPVGTSSITANYPGDANFGAATSAAIPIVVSAAPPAVTVTPSSLTFSSQTTGSTSSPQPITLTNSGQSALTIASIAASGDFAETNTCGASLAPGSACAISVTFTPTASGTRSGSLTIEDNAGSSPQAIALNGTGSSVTVTTPNSSGMTINSAGGSASTTLQIGSVGGFSGTVNLSCAVAFQGAGAPTDPPTCNLNPTQEQVTSGATVNVTLTVNTTGASSAMLFHPFGEGTAFVAFAFLVFLPRRRRHGLVLLIVVGFTTAWALTACGGSGSSGGGKSQNSGTTTGSYNVTVTATSGKDTASATVPLSVQ